MRSCFLVITFFISLSLAGQRIIPSTDSFQITGNVKAIKIFSIAALDSFPETPIQDLVIYNQRGEIKDTIKNLKGVPMKTILAQTALIYDKPKELNEFYFVLKAADGYKVVLSWNEIYNTPSGDNFYIITEMEGKKIQDMKERILFVAVGDLKSGRRFVQGLDRIEIKRAD